MQPGHRLRLIATVLLTALAPALAAAQTVQFAQSSASVLETAGSIAVDLTISGPSEVFGGVLVETFGDPATPGEDYAHTQDFIMWEPGESGNKPVVIPILDDQEAEGPETFEFRITNQDGATIGEPDVMVITILDDESPGGPVASIDVMDAVYSPGGSATFFGLGGQTLDITVRLDRVPESPYTVDFVSEFPPTSGTLTFDDTDEQTVSVQLPQSETLSVGSFSIAPGAPPKLANKLFDVLIAAPGLSFLETCIGCALYIYTTWVDSFFGCPIECPWFDLCYEKTAPKRAAPVTVLRRYRDEVLDTTSAGRYFVDFFEDHNVALGVALLKRPTFIHRIARAQQAWVDALEALVDGNGDSALVTQQMEDDLLALLAEFEELADPTTAADIQRERIKLQLESIAGLTIAEYQAQIEALGTVSTTTSSWGRVKSRF